MAEEKEKKTLVRYVYSVSVYEDGYHEITPMELAKDVPSIGIEDAKQDALILGKKLKDERIASLAVNRAFEIMSEHPEEYGLKKVGKEEESKDGK